MCLNCCPSNEWRLKNKFHDQKIEYVRNNQEWESIFKKTVEYDTVDNPRTKKCIQLKSPDDTYLEIMKCEKNRHDSFENKWPLPFINFKDLTKAGFFYLQSDDRVQCAFCKLILYSWQNGDEPMKEHIRHSPKCLHLKTLSHFTNIRKTVEKSTLQHSNNYNEYVPVQSISFIPHNPRMTDVEKRLHTFENWSYSINKKELAKCGFYSVGYKDVVTCFACGKSHACWKPTDNPVVEHLKYYPDCPNLKNHPLQSKRESIGQHNIKKSNVSQPLKQILIEEILKSIIVKEAKEIFPSVLVDEVVYQHLIQTGQKFSSLHQLCEKVIEYDEKQIKSRLKSAEVHKPASVTPKSETVHTKGNSSLNNTKDILLCKICMDKERNTTFKPCRHLVSCENCAALLTECPLCRTRIESREKIYLS